MEVYRRGDDQDLFDWFSSMYQESDEELPHLVRGSKQRYPVRVGFL